MALLPTRAEQMSASITTAYHCMMNQKPSKKLARTNATNGNLKFLTRLRLGRQ